MATFPGARGIVRPSPGAYPKLKKLTQQTSGTFRRNPSVTGGTLAPPGLAGGFRDRVKPTRPDAGGGSSTQDDRGSAEQQLARKLASGYNKRRNVALRRPVRSG